LQNLVVSLWQATQKTILYVTHSVPEAVFLADRVVALTPGPGEVRDIVDIALPKPRDRYGKDFLAYEKQLALLVRTAKTDDTARTSTAAGGLR
jgi:NitT/TauT family transport system ATP-binding protein